MDTLTHGLSGALVGRALTSRTRHVKPKAFVLVGFLAGIFPDFDFLFTLISSHAYLMNHRGITHSLFLMPVWALFIALFSAWIFKNKILWTDGWVDSAASIKQLTKELWIVGMFGIALHILGDVVTSFGTMFLAPFSNQRFETGSVFIIDLWFSAILVAGLVASWIIKKHKHLVAALFLVIWAGYIGFTYYMKTKAQDVAVSYLQSNNINLSDVKIYSTPRPVSSYNWTVTAFDKKNEVYYTSDFSLNEKKTINHDYRNHGFIESLNNSFPSYKEAIWQKITLWGCLQICK